MIKIQDLFPNIKKKDLEDYKIHLAIGGKGKDNRYPLYEFIRGRFKEYQECQNAHNFGRKYIFSLIYYRKDEWIFAGIYKVKSYRKIEKHYKYDTELLNINEDLIGRLVLHYKKPHPQNTYLKLEKVFYNLEIIELFRDKIKFQKFPGFENINISYSELKDIIKFEYEQWKSALLNVQGIYLISDKETGKLYVGAAYGEDAFWQRWKKYAVDASGGNKKLKEVLDEKGYDYANNFQFSILEIYSKQTSTEKIIKREEHWKNILLTRKFGYNKN
ncbi:MAG: GIY-YIG nuclease family protein [Candidatus Helarchaeota archaeon]